MPQQPHGHVACWRLFVVLLCALSCLDGGARGAAPRQGPGVLSGVVVDERGRPVEGVSVRTAVAAEAPAAAGASAPDAARTWSDTHRNQIAETDATGRYHFDDLPPADYVVIVGASHRSSSLPGVTPCTAPLPWAAGNFEYVEPFRIEPVEALVDRTRGFERLIDAGLAPPPESALKTVYLTTYSPSVTSLTEAARVRVGGGEAARADIRLQTWPSVRFAGRLARPGGARGHVRLTLTGPVAVAETFSQPDGTFVFMHVPVGAYRFSGEAVTWSCDFRESNPLRWEAGVDWPVTTGIEGATVRLSETGASVGAAELIDAPVATEPLMAPETASIVGRVSSASGTRISRARLRLDDDEGRATASAVTTDDGRYRLGNIPNGTYLLTVSRNGWEDTMYGQTRRLGEGTAIRLESGAAFVADVVMRRHGTISGVVLDETGRPIPDVQVWAPFNSTLTDSRGRYRLGGIVEGQRPVRLLLNRNGLHLDTYYPDTDEAHASRVDVVGGGETSDVNFSVRPLPAAELEVAPRVAPDAKVTAQFVFDGTAEQPRYPVRWSLISVTNDTPWRSAEFSSPAPNTVAAGRYIVRAPLPDTTWTARSAMVDGIDALDQPFLIEAGQERRVVVTFTDRHSLLEGRVRNPDGTPMARVTVLAFSADPGHWTGLSRRIRVVRPQSDGRYTVADLPTGTYKVAAVIGLADDEATSFEFFRQLADRAEAVTIVEGETVEQDASVLRPLGPG